MLLPVATRSFNTSESTSRWLSGAARSGRFLQPFTFNLMLAAKFLAAALLSSSCCRSRTIVVMFQ